MVFRRVLLALATCAVITSNAFAGTTGYNTSLFGADMTNSGGYSDDASSGNVKVNPQDQNGSGALYRFGPSTIDPYPTEPARVNFNFAKAGVSISPNIGCANMDLQSLMSTYFGVDYKNILSYLESEAMGMVINYLIYSSPTLYSLLQDLKKSHDVNFSSYVASCEGIRNLAVNSWRNKDKYEDAKQLCLAQETSLYKCNQDSVLQKYQDQFDSDQNTAMTNESNSQKSSSGSSAGSSGDSGSGGSGNTSGGDTKDSGEKKDDCSQYVQNLNEYLFSDVDLKPNVRAFINSFYNAKGYDCKKQVEAYSQRAAYSEHIKGYRAYFVENLSTAVTNAQSGKGFNAQLQAINGFDGVQVIRPDIITSINHLPPDERVHIISSIGSKMAIARFVGESRSAADAVAAALGTERKMQQLHKADFDFYHQKTDEILSYVNSLQREAEAANAMNEYLLQIYEAGQRSRGVSGK